MLSPESGRCDSRGFAPSSQRGGGGVVVSVSRATRASLVCLKDAVLIDLEWAKVERQKIVEGYRLVVGGFWVNGCDRDSVDEGFPSNLLLNNHVWKTPASLSCKTRDCDCEFRNPLIELRKLDCMLLYSGCVRELT